MNTVFFIGFKPNSNKRVYDIIDINSDNPFTALSESLPMHYYYSHHTIFTYRVLHCDKHEIYGLLNLIDSYQNVWRVLEVLHYLVPKTYGKLPLSWYYMIDYLGDKSFHRDIKNIPTGHRKIYLLCYNALEHLLAYLVNGTDGKFHMNNINVDWSHIKLILIEIVNLLIADKICICHKHITYHPFLDGIKREFPIVIRSQLNEWLNNIPLLWENDQDYNQSEVKKKYYTLLDQLLSNPPEKAIRRRAKSIHLPYDLLNESKRMDYIKRKISYHYTDDYFNGEHCVPNTYMLGIEEPLPELYHIKSSSNQCYVCDVSLLENYSHVKIINGVITEFNQDQKFTQVQYPMTHRCVKCKKGKYGIINNYILARHYKWMTFLCGFYDLNSNLCHLPLDVANVIILIYQYIR